ncbi:hypothetical protein DL89DRAFT_36375 [Linderina pennispora]|uniref:Secreted protein n=1 Tax=Linderina pennispora TaxID=61395 RepID=A0A1Y1W2K3_9FUNG|nr:uncharacterized protein DL89DRAFT_36375 [Linderina pennispora]ORX67773.1 hypothetical protein DL89DRAFT_36375 [Linderina pennispora]
MENCFFFRRCVVNTMLLVSAWQPCPHADKRTSFPEPPAKRNVHSFRCKRGGRIRLAFASVKNVGAAVRERTHTPSTLGRPLICKKPICTPHTCRSCPHSASCSKPSCMLCILA